MLKTSRRSLALAISAGLLASLVSPVVASAQANAGSVSGPESSIQGPSTKPPAVEVIAPVTPPLAHPQPAKVLLKKGSRGIAVLKLEQRVHMLKPDRVYDAKTVVRVKQIQKWAKVSRTGAVDTSTDRIISKWNRSRAGQTVAAQVRTTSRLGRIIDMARHYSGRPYVAGGAGPSSFDCSGFTRYVVEHAIGRTLPHQSGEQASTVRRISRSQARPGDLVFFTHGGHVYHVGIYAGHGRLYHASEPGTRSGLGPIFSSNVFFGRVV